MNVTEALDAAGVEWKRGSSEDEIWLNCPFCVERNETEDTRYRLGINIVNGEGHCFNCNWSSRSPEYTFRELQRALDTGLMTAAKSKHKKKKVEVVLPEDFELISTNGHRREYWHEKAYRYLRKRGITDKQIADKQIGFSVTDHSMHHRIVFPVYYRHKLLGLVGRDFTGKQEPTYKNSDGDKGLYNIPSHSQNKSICLSEAVFTTLAIERGAKKLSIDSAGLLGHSLQDSSLEMLQRYKTVYLWLDPDAEGIKGAISIAKKIEKEKLVRIVLPKGFKHDGVEDKDPDELETHEITHRLNHAPVFTPELQTRLKAWIVMEDD